MTRIYKILIAALFLTGSLALKAQQEPQYTQYMFNKMLINPACAGIEETLEAQLMSRWQWVGLEGAPRSHSFSVQSPIPGQDMGLGISVITDNYGPVRNNYISANYSYRVKLNQEITLAMGLKGGFYNYKVGLSELATNDADDAFLEDYKKNFIPNLGTGAYVYTDEYYAGFSIPKFFKSELEEVGTDDMETELKRHIFLTGGYKYYLNPEWTIVPSALMKLVGGAPPSVDITAQALYLDRFWFGTTWRIGSALGFQFQMDINSQMRVGYAYDVTTSEVRNTSDGSHEIMLSYRFDDFVNKKFLGTY